MNKWVYGYLSILNYHYHYKPLKTDTEQLKRVTSEPNQIRESRYKSKLNHIQNKDKRSGENETVIM